MPGSCGARGGVRALLVGVLIASSLLTVAAIPAQQGDPAARLATLLAELRNRPVVAADTTAAEEAVGLARTLGRRQDEATALLLLARAESLAKRVDAALESLERARSLLEEPDLAGSPSVLELSLTVLDEQGMILQASDRTAESIEPLARAVALLRGASDPRLPTLLGSLALARYLSGDLDGALGDALEALKLTDAATDDGAVIIACQVAGLVHRDLEHHQEALDMFRRGAALAQEHQDIARYLQLLNEEGNVLLAMGDLAGARASKDIGLALAQATGDTMLTASYLHDLGAIDQQEGKLADAMRSYEEAYRLMTSIGRWREAAIAASNLASLCTALGRQPEGLLWAEHAVQHADAAGLPAVQQAAQEVLASALNRSGRYAEAFSTLEKSLQLREQVYSEESARAIAALRARFETERKQHEIEVLQRDRAIQDLELRREQILRRFAIAAVLLLACLLALAAHGYRLKVRANLKIAETNRQLGLAQQELERLARTDPLTGLANRRALLERVEEESLRSARSRRPFSLILGDLDGFKTINDTYGHETGDRVLQSVADVLRGAIRSVDLAGRWGGEEVLVLLPETDGDGAVSLAERIRERVAALEVTTDGTAVPVRITLGVSTCADDGLDGCLRRADVALYQGKRDGKNRVVRG